MSANQHFMNYVLGQKIAIMSDKRRKQQEIKFKEFIRKTMLKSLFLDTPGIHKPKHELGEFMVKSAYSALKEVDAVLFMVNVSEKPWTPGRRLHYWKTKRD